MAPASAAAAEAADAVAARASASLALCCFCRHSHTCWSEVHEVAAKCSEAWLVDKRQSPETTSTTCVALHDLCGNTESTASVQIVTCMALHLHSMAQLGIAQLKHTDNDPSQLMTPAAVWHLQESTFRLGIGSDLVLGLFGLGWLLLASCRLHLVGFCLLSVRLQQGAQRPALVTHSHSQRSIASHDIGIKARTQQQGAQHCAYVKAVAPLQNNKLTWWPQH